MIICALLAIGSVEAYLVLRTKPLTVSGMKEVKVGEEATFTVTFENEPVEGAIVKVDNQTKLTGANGTVKFEFNNPGDYVVMAIKKGYRNASFSVKVVQLLMLPNDDIEDKGACS